MTSQHVPRRTTRLRVAQLIGASVVAAIGQLAVNMPEAYFGPRDDVTSLGWIYTGVLALVTAIESWGQFRGRGRPSFLTPTLLCVNVGAFVPAIATDPAVAGTVALWQAVVLVRHYVDRPHVKTKRELRRHFDPDAHAPRWLARRGAALRHLTVVSLLVWMAVVGYEQGDHPLAQIVLAVMFAVTVIPAANFIVTVARHGSKTAILVWIPLLGALPTAFIDPRIALSLTALHFALTLLLILRFSPTMQEIVRHFQGRPALFVVYTFASAIVLGAVALTFPACSAPGHSISPVDALFTSTSAVCVTGLVVLDTPVDFSLVGQMVILALIQIGGLGIMALSSIATMALSGGLRVRAEHALGQTLEAPGSRTAHRLVVFVVAATFVIEAVGAVALYPVFAGDDVSFWMAAWKASFHSISAFCNAGFALQSDSLVSFQGQPFVLAIFAVLITLGGLGFSVLAVAWARLRGHRHSRLSVQVRVVIWSSLALVVGGAIAYGALEWNASLDGLSAWDRVTNAIFQSVTLRTAGFNSVDYAPLRPATTILMAILMLIGASPGGTGGGIKTTTVVLLLAVVPAIGRGESRVSLFGRTIPQAVVYRAATVAAVTVGVFALGTILLALALPGNLETVVFEAASAVGTVGLTIGATAELAPSGKYLVAALMFVGRVGPLTLVLMLSGRSPRRAEFPTEVVAVG